MRYIHKLAAPVGLLLFWMTANVAHAVIIQTTDLDYETVVLYNGPITKNTRIFVPTLDKNIIADCSKNTVQITFQRQPGDANNINVTFTITSPTGGTWPHYFSPKTFKLYDPPSNTTFKTYSTTLVAYCPTDFFINLNVSK